MKKFMYEGFNKRSLYDKAYDKTRGFYDKNKEIIIAVATGTAALAALTALSLGLVNKIDQEVEKDMQILERAVDMPRSDANTLENNFYRLKSEDK